jgi:xylulokinase
VLSVSPRIFLLLDWKPGVTLASPLHLIGKTTMSATLLGLDIGSSSVKGVLIDAATGKTVAHASSPETEMAIDARYPGWAEQHPDLWWEHACRVISSIRASCGDRLKDLKAIGIAYQMHGLVLVDKNGKPLRPAIIWCDSRAVSYGAKAFKQLGPDNCLKRFGNSPGSFTAANLGWVRENEPEVLKQAAAFMLPGDYIALRLTGEMGTTRSGLSEGVLWDFSTNSLALPVLETFGVPTNLAPQVGDNVSPFAKLRPDVARELGLPPDVAVTYRSGDQPNNALALNVLNPGELAANAGTSGVVYGVTDELKVDPQSRVNNFLHVNSKNDLQRVGVLMCINGTGSFYRWVRSTFAPNISYPDLNSRAKESPVGAKGLIAIPYGNGAERTLGNVNLGASFEGIDLNRHGLPEILRATQEGIVFALCYGVEIMKTMGLAITKVRAGNANMFQSPLFRETFATALNVPIELYTTDGAEGAARGAGIGAGLLSYSSAFAGLRNELTIEPDRQTSSMTCDAYERWKLELNKKSPK